MATLCLPPIVMPIKLFEFERKRDSERETEINREREGERGRGWRSFEGRK